MAKARIIYGVMLLAAFIFSQALYDPISLMTLIIVILIPFISALMALLSYHSISIKASVAGDQFFRFERFKININICNNSPFICPCFKILGRIPLSDGEGIGKAAFVIHCPLSANNLFSYEVSLNYRGVYQLGVDSVEYYDIFRLIKIRKSINKSISVLILPRNINVDFPLAFYTRMNDNTSMAGFTPAQSGDIIGVRDYNSGDSLRNVHWKLSSKTQQLMVKTFAEDLSAQVYIIADLGSYRKTELENKRLVDCIVETAISLIRQYSQNSVMSCLIYADENSFSNMHNITTVQEAYLAQRSIAIAGMQDAISIQQTIQSLDSPSLSGSKIYILTSLNNKNYINTINAFLQDIDCTADIFLFSETDNSSEYFNDSAVTVIDYHTIEGLGGKN